jgi:DNA polymerase-3 subunit delta'
VTTPSIWSGVVGQRDAIERLEASAAAGGVHAYLFVGPHGSTKEEAARAFASLLLTGSTDPAGRDARLVLAGEHPDVREVRRVGPAIAADQAREIVRLAALAPVEGSAKVMILDEFHLLRPEGAARLLKTIEEPPDSTTFIVVCDFVPPDLVTISSRCLRIEFRRIGDDEIADRLVADGVAPDAARLAASAAAGDLPRARVLAADPTLAARRQAFAAVPHRLNGSGSVATAAAAELLALIEDAVAPLAARHAEEIAEIEAEGRPPGPGRQAQRASGAKTVEDRHKRELRRHRTDELRSGLGTLAGTYRDAATSGSATDVDRCVEAVHLIHVALEALERNPNERLLLEALLWSLPDAHGVG